MKRVILLLTLLFVVGASAQSGATGRSHYANNDALSQFVYYGQRYESEQLNLKTVKTVYEEKWVNSTCYKQESYFVEECGYKDVVETICTTTPSKKECKMVNGKLVCKVVPGKKICRDEVTTKWVCGPVEKFRTVSYPCKKKELVAVEAVNKKFIANLRFHFNYTNLDPELMIKNELNDQGEVTLEVRNLDDSAVVLLANKTVRKQKSGYFDLQNIEYRVTAFDQNALLSHISVKPSDLMMTRNSLDFEVGKIQFPERAKFVVKITDLSTKRVLINRELQEYEYRTYSNYYSNASSQVSINNLRGMGVRLQYGRQYRVKVTSKVDIGEFEMLNTDIEKLSVSKAKTIRL